MNRLIDQTFDMIQIVDKKIKHHANQSIQALGLTAQQGKLIKYIYLNQDKPLIQKDLADYFSKTTVSMGSMLKILEREGYVERFIPPENSRQKQIRLLAKGNAVVEEFDAKMKRLHQEAAAFLTEEEFQQLFHLLTKLDEKLS